MTSCIPSISSSSLPFPTSSVTFLDLRPLPAPPPDPPPQICFFSSESHSQLPLSTLSSLTRPLQPLPLVDLKSRLCRLFSLVSGASGFCGSSMPQLLRLFTAPPLSQISNLTPSCSFTAVCRRFSGLYPASNFTRFNSGFAIYFSTVYVIYWLDSELTSLISWKCVTSLVTFAFMNAWLVYKALVSHLPWLCIDNMCHAYSSMEQFVVLSFSPFGGNNCYVGTKIFSGATRGLTFSSLCGMSLCFSNVAEVPLFDGHIRHRQVTSAIQAERLGLHVSLEAKEASLVMFVR